MCHCFSVTTQLCDEDDRCLSASHSPGHQGCQLHDANRYTTGWATEYFAAYKTYEKHVVDGRLLIGYTQYECHAVLIFSR